MPTLLGGSVLLILALAQGTEATKRVRADELGFLVPESWILQERANPMRRAELMLPAAEGDPEETRLVVYFFPGGAGTVEANRKRWEEQFELPEGRSLEEVRTFGRKRVAGMDVTTLEILGTYVAAISPERPGERQHKPGHRMFAAIVESPRGPFYFKTVGPERTMMLWKDDLSRMIDSLLWEEEAPPVRRFAGRLSFLTPADWIEEKPSSPVRKAELLLPAVHGEERETRLVVTFFPGGAGSVEANLDRWEGQFEVPDGSTLEEVKKVSTSTISGMKVTVLRMAGTYVAPISPQRPDERHLEPGYRMIGAIVESPEGAFYVKVVGPAATVSHWEGAIEKAIASIAWSADR